PPETALRGRDLVTLGVTGHKFGFSLPNRRDRERVDVLVAE
ncbi:MAG TPA: ABC transporter ATP-binding protein, partial [Microbacterium sp.]|nr:ABC transporter ATP-binding protein [Microbacterium sp.]